MKRNLILFLYSFIFFSSFAATSLEDARKEIESGNFEQGKTLLEQIAKENKKTAQSAEYIYLLGLCELDEGAEKKGLAHLNEAAKKNFAKAYLALGRHSFLKYDFESASDYYSDYRRVLEKGKKPVPEELDLLEDALTIAENAFDRVEKVIVIDSLSFPRESFYENYRLLPSAGSILKGGGESGNPDIGSEEIAFFNEDKDFAIWETITEDGEFRLQEGQKLLDGTWVNHESMSGNFDLSGNYRYPFMSADGQTLYFAGDGPESMGGYDLFIAQRDPLTGEYRQPLNMGMPYNSPYDDIMLAVDEENGLGWWATDRNSPKGEVTVFIYLLKDIRENYPSETEDLVSYARIDDFKSTQDPELSGQYNNKLKNLPDFADKGNSNKSDFSFRMNSGKVYRNLSDFKNRKASEQMKLYLKKTQELEKAESTLKRLRKDYSSKNKNGVEKIEQMEQQTSKLRIELKALEKEIYRLERTNR